MYRIYCNDVNSTTWYLGTHGSPNIPNNVNSLIAEMLNHNENIYSEIGFRAHISGIPDYKTNTNILAIWLAKDEYPEFKSNYLGLNPEHKPSREHTEGIVNDILFHDGIYTLEPIS